ncbi:PQQ-binding-like beta-propeller repeat protein [Halovivax cerinus]|uniref:PQQ-binding-like beta-propeller repeat protein n=1 Tax=Halovivax cerinus TaxID=1487865 RepID=A0ABD5NR80_9EURY|nr:PQQ-binding-like beta-propeller repeat protein [Halovivax cerinus]
MGRRATRRHVLLAGASAGLSGIVAGCLSETDRFDERERIDDRSYQTRPDGVAQFRRSLENWGYEPNETVPDSVEQEWRLPEHNTHTHNAAKASAVPLGEDGVAFPGDTGDVSAISSDGEILWRGETGAGGPGIHGTPVVADGRVYIGAYDGVCYAFDAETGEERWSTDLGDAIGSSPKYDGDRLFVAVEYDDPEGNLFALDPETGDVVWEEPAHRPTGHPHCTPAIDPDAGRLVLGSNDGTLYGWEYPSLEFAWSFDTNPENDSNGEIKGPIAAYDGGAFFGSWDDHIYRVDLEDGTLDWAFRTGRYAMAGPGIDPVRHAVFVGCHDGRMYALDPDTGDPFWRFSTDAPLTGSVAVCADRIVFGSKDRTLYALDSWTGDEVWHVDHDGFVTSAPLVHNGAIYYAERAPDPENGDADGGAYKLVSA